MVFVESTLSIVAATMAVIFLAEIGDKTMISTALFAAQTRKYVQVLFASTLAFALANVLPIYAGHILRFYVSANALRIAAVALFIAIGVWMLLSSEEHEKRVAAGILACFLVVLLSEIGDKTQLAALSMSIMSGSPIAVLVGSVLGYLSANVLGVLLVGSLSKVVAWSKIKKASAIIMIVVGVLLALSVV